MIYEIVGNKATGWISKRVLKQSVCVSGSKKYSFSGKCNVLCFPVTPVLRIALLPHYRRYILFRICRKRAQAETNKSLIHYKSVYPKCHFVFLINRNVKSEIKFWFLFLYWSWDRKHQNKWFFDFQNNWTLKFKFEVSFSFFILIWKTKNEIYLNKYLMKLVTIPLTQS